MTIRPTTPADVSRLADLTTQLGYPSSPEEVEARLRDLASRPEENAVLVAEEDGEAVGWIHVSALYSLEMDPCAQIQGLVIDQSRRGGGIGAEAHLFLRSLRGRDARSFDQLLARRQSRRPRR